MAGWNRWIAAAALAAGIVVAAGLTGSAGHANAIKRPNVLVIETDDQTVESLRVILDKLGEMGYIDETAPLLAY